MGIVVLVEGKNWNDIIDGKTVPVSVLLIVVGLVIAVVGFLGCFGAMKQNGNMLLLVSTKFRNPYLVKVVYFLITVSKSVLISVRRHPRTDHPGSTRCWNPRLHLLGRGRNNCDVVVT